MIYRNNSFSKDLLILYFSAHASKLAYQPIVAQRLVCAVPNQLHRVVQPDVLL